VAPVVYTIEVENPVGPAVGLVIDDVALPASFNAVTASATSDDRGAVLTVVSTNPLHVTSPTLGAGNHVTVQITANAQPGCSDGDVVITASAYATNSLERDARATLDGRAGANGPEVCDGKDNNCNGQVDEGANLCDDHNACTIDSCGGASGSSHEWIPGCVPCQTAADCDDGNACNGVETCDPATGCHAGTPLICGHGNTCTVETGCAHCSTAASAATRRGGLHALQDGGRLRRLEPLHRRRLRCVRQLRADHHRRLPALQDGRGLRRRQRLHHQRLRRWRVPGSPDRRLWRRGLQRRHRQRRRREDRLPG
jgi:hypothetical protein